MDYKLSEFSIPDHVWRIYPCPADPRIIVETRSQDTRQVKFYSCHLTKEGLSNEFKKLPEQWWIGLAGIYSDVALFHVFKDVENPEGIKIYAFNIQTGVYLWSNEFVKFIRHDKGLIFVRMLDESSSCYLDLHTGEEVLVSQDQAIDEELITTATFYPHQIFEDDKEHLKFKNFISQYLNKQITGTIEYLEFNNHIIFSFHYRKESNFVASLVMMDDQGKVLLEEVLYVSEKGFAKDLFFIHFQNLIYLNSDRKIVVHRF